MINLQNILGNLISERLTISLTSTNESNDEEVAAAVGCKKNCRFIYALSRITFLTYSKKNILKPCRTWRLGTINIMNGNTLAEVSISLIKMTPKVKHNQPSASTSISDLTLL